MNFNSSGNTSFSERLKPVTRQYDRDSLAANIKLFEPIVIQALKVSFKYSFKVDFHFFISSDF
jgi:hypothetical protein